ncbi:AAA family ATPase [Sagittula sp. S175]|uniref:AAA family ATPase n=1 Tax=Sagittula sp. S175 TaxID=3415129 RepID=UPI003C79ED72
MSLLPKTRPVAGAETPAWAAYVCTDQGAELARAVFDRMGQGDGTLRGGGLSGAARVSGDGPVARRVLAEMGNLPVEAACEGVAEIRGSGAEVIVLGHASDLGTYRALRQAGALEYFAFPVSAEEIAALRMGAVNDTVPVSRAPVIGVLGSNGGVGASLLAQNLAFHGARVGQRVALVDGDLRFGSQALDLDVLETPGLVEALAAPDRVDGTFLDATMISLSEQLSLYACHAAGEDVTALEAAFPRLMTPLRAQFGAVVLDLPRATVLARPEIAEALDVLVMVVPAGYAGVSAASRLRARLQAAAPDLRLLPVLSELRRDAGLSRRDMEHGLEMPLAAVLPRSEAALGRAHRAGRSLVEMQPRAPYARAVSALWAQVTGAEAARRRRLLG